MPRWLAQGVRAATVIAFATALVLAARLLLGSTGPGVETPALGAGELDVAHAITPGADRRVVVRGYVFDGPPAWGLRLCNARDRRDGAPHCVGPFLDLQGVDPGSFELRRAKTREGVEQYSPGAVTVSGSVTGTVIHVAVVFGRS